MMNSETSTSGNHSKARAGVSAVCVVVILAAGWMIARSSWRAQGAMAAAGDLDNLEGREYLIKCEACGQQFKMSAKAYMLLVQTRDTDSDDGITCALCGAHRAWREYGERHRGDATESESIATALGGNAPTP